MEINYSYLPSPKNEPPNSSSSRKEAATTKTAI
jgi:hypothetical protein